MIAIVGCGNPNRSDDGVGPEVVRLLGGRGVGADARAVALIDAGTDGMSVMFRARGCAALIVVDGCVSGSEPGAVFELRGQALEREPPASPTLHDFRWEHALYAGRRTFGADFPQDVTVYLIEAATLEFGIGLSPPVAAAADIVAERIAGRVGARQAA